MLSDQLITRLSNVVTSANRFSSPSLKWVRLHEVCHGKIAAHLVNNPHAARFSRGYLFRP